MRRLLLKSLVGTGLAFSAFTLGAQQYNPQQYPPRGDTYRYDRDDYRNALLSRVRTDLDNAQSQTTPFAGDRWRIARAKESLREFQQRLNDGDYSRRVLDTAIDNMQRVVDNNRLPYRWQQYLSNDVNRLRQLQTRLDGGV